MRKICTVMAIFIIAIATSGCGSKPMLKLENNKIPSLNNGSPMKLEVVKSVILRSCEGRGWVTKDKGGNVIEAQYSGRDHRAIIEIPYSQNSYSIVYKDSDGLGYKNGKIHNNYNRWVRYLSEDIQLGIDLRLRGF